MFNTARWNLCMGEIKKSATLSIKDTLMILIDLSIHICGGPVCPQIFVLSPTVHRVQFFYGLEKRPRPSRKVVIINVGLPSMSVRPSNAVVVSTSTSTYCFQAFSWHTELNHIPPSLMIWQEDQWTRRHFWSGWFRNAQTEKLNSALNGNTIQISKTIPADDATTVKLEMNSSWYSLQVSVVHTCVRLISGPWGMSPALGLLHNTWWHETALKNKIQWGSETEYHIGQCSSPDQWRRKGCTLCASNISMLISRRKCANNDSQGEIKT